MEKKTSKSDPLLLMILFWSKRCSTVQYSIGKTFLPHFSAPEAPGNIKLTILTANPKEYDVDYVNTTISWDPPAHTNHGEEIIQYVVEWRKEPPIQAAHLIVDHHGKLQINAVSTMVLNVTVNRGNILMVN